MFNEIIELDNFFTIDCKGEIIYKYCSLNDEKQGPYS